MTSPSSDAWPRELLPQKEKVPPEPVRGLVDPLWPKALAPAADQCVPDWPENQQEEERTQAIGGQNRSKFGHLYASSQAIQPLQPHPSGILLQTPTTGKLVRCGSSKQHVLRVYRRVPGHLNGCLSGQGAVAPTPESQAQGQRGETREAWRGLTVSDRAQMASRPDHAVSALSLCFVETLVDLRQNVLKRFTICRPAPYSGTQRQVLRSFALDGDRNSAQFLSELVDTLHCSLHVHPRESHDEFLATEPGDEVAGSYRLPEPLGE